MTTRSSIWQLDYEWHIVIYYEVLCIELHYDKYRHIRDV